MSLFRIGDWFPLGTMRSKTEHINQCKCVTAIRRYKTSHVKFCRHFKPNLYRYYIPYFLHAHFTSDLRSQAQNILNEVCQKAQVNILHINDSFLRYYKPLLVRIATHSSELLATSCSALNNLSIELRKPIST